jgi:hypothetical protein
VILGCQSQGLLIATGDGTGEVPGNGGAVVGADWTSSRPPRAASRSAMFRRHEPSGMWRRLTWQQLPEPRLGQNDLEERTPDGRPPMLLCVCATVFDCCQGCCHGCSQLSTEDDGPGTSAQHVTNAGTVLDGPPTTTNKKSVPATCPTGRATAASHGHSRTVGRGVLRPENQQVADGSATDFPS